ncbi:MAG TPA: hypothetical protein VJU82_12885, partial [Acidobacteriaceae bacterium]|nr:hypothetical protein [Acidobacteriaceae bacterium]
MILALVAMFSVQVHTGLAVMGFLALALLTATILASMFGPMPRYHIARPEQLPPNESEDFLGLVESLSDAKINRRGSFQVLTDGPSFYPAELEAMRNAQKSINLEAYIFQKSEIGRMYLEALTERARAGVEVNVLLDFFGSAGATRSFFKP